MSAGIAVQNLRLTCTVLYCKIIRFYAIKVNFYRFICRMICTLPKDTADLNSRQSME